jgi:predicted regulator of Ras-like GTPase activity (Roadblock/LC7/MglB family)
MAVKGSLQDIQLVDIIQLNCRSRDVAKLSLAKAQGERPGEIYFADGEIVHAAYDGEVGEEAVHKLLEWDHGYFVLEKEVTTPQRSIQTSWRTLLLQAMKAQDEQRAQQNNAEKEVSKEKEIDVTDILQSIVDDLPAFVALHVIDSEREILIAHLSDNHAFTHSEPTANLAQLVKTANQTLALINAGRFSEMITSTEKYRVIIRPLGPSHYHIRVVLNTAGSIGAARLYLADKEQELLNRLSAEGAIAAALGQ